MADITIHNDTLQPAGICGSNLTAYLHRGQEPSFAMDVSEVLRLLAFYNQGTLTILSEVQRRTMERLLVAGKAMLEASVRKHINDAGELPVLVSYSSDGTPIKSTHTVQYNLATTGEKSRKRGHRQDEVLIQQAFVRYFDAAGHCHTKVLLREALPLVHGKGGAANFACTREWCPFPRDEGHSGISISHYCHDGALASVMTTHMLRHHFQKAIDRRQQTTQDSKDPVTQYLKEWVVSSQCCIHACHNSLQWACGKALAAAHT